MLQAIPVLCKCIVKAEAKIKQKAAKLLCSQIFSYCLLNKPFLCAFPCISPLTVRTFNKYMLTNVPACWWDIGRLSSSNPHRKLKKRIGIFHMVFFFTVKMPSSSLLFSVRKRYRNLFKKYFKSIRIKRKLMTPHISCHHYRLWQLS